MDNNLVNKLCEFSEKFKNLFIHKKKLKALNNFAEVAEFQKNHKVGLKLIATFVDEGFLDEHDVTYLNHLLDKYELKFTEWSYRTKWIKQQMERIRRERAGLKPRPQYRETTIFELLEQKKKDQTVSIPVEILAKQTPTQTAARA